MPKLYMYQKGPDQIFQMGNFDFSHDGHFGLAGGGGGRGVLLAEKKIEHRPGAGLLPLPDTAVPERVRGPCCCPTLVGEPVPGRLYTCRLHVWHCTWAWGGVGCLGASCMRGSTQPDDFALAALQSREGGTAGPWGGGAEGGGDTEWVRRRDRRARKTPYKSPHNDGLQAKAWGTHFTYATYLFVIQSNVTDAPPFL